MTNFSFNIDPEGLNGDMCAHWEARARDILTPDEFAQFSINKDGKPTAPTEILRKFLQGIGAELPPEA